MRGILIILVLLAMLFGGYMIYRNLAEQTSGPDDPTHIQTIEKARKGAKQLQDTQNEIHRRAKEASD